MYRFNFLNKINQEKLETKKRDRFIRMIFISSTVCLALLLVFLFLQSLNIGSNFKEAQSYQAKITEKSVSFRNKDFFRYKSIENVYNSALKRKNITAILNIVETSLDSSIILSAFLFYEKKLDLKFVSRTSSSKSQLMSRMNILKNDINEKLIQLKYIDEKLPIKLTKGPEIEKSFDDFQYWVFDFEAEFIFSAPAKPTEESSSSDTDIKI